MEIKYRLDILKTSGQISEKTYDQVEKIILHFQNNHHIEITEENGAMLVTHLCIALSRIEKDEKVNKIEDDIFKDVINNSHYKTAEEAMKEIDMILGSDMSIEERGYMIMHLCVLFENTSRNK